MKIVCNLIILSFILFGCSSTIKTKKQEIERQPLNLEMPSSLKSKDVNWVIITPENNEEVFQKLQNDNSDPVIFGLSDLSYKNLSLNLAELKRYIIEQKEIIKAYKEYYEGEIKEP